MRFLLILMATTVVVAAPVLAAEEKTPHVNRTTTVFGDDPCPKAEEGEIIVCGRLPESERYRIPQAFRKGPRIESGPSASWTSKVEVLEAAQRFTMPGSCTAVGTSGQTGCTQAMIRQWFLERRALQQERDR